MAATLIKLSAAYAKSETAAIFAALARRIRRYQRQRRAGARRRLYARLRATLGFGERLTTGVTGQISFRPIAHWFVIGGLVMLAVTIYSLYRLVKELQYRKRVKEGLEPRRHSGDARHSGSADSFTRRQSVELGVV